MATTDEPGVIVKALIENYDADPARRKLVGTADDVAIALLVDHAQVAGVHPAAGVDRLPRALGIAPVAAHHAVAAGQQFPGVPRGTTRPFASMIFTCTWGCTRPTVPTRRSSGSSGRALKAHGTGLRHAVADGHSGMCISVTTRRITAIGQGDPAMMPVRSDDRSNSPNRGCSSSAMNMVGTPCSAVQRLAPPSPAPPAARSLRRETPCRRRA